MNPDEFEKIFEEARAKIQPGDAELLAKLEKARAKMIESKTKLDSSRENMKREIQIESKGLEERKQIGLARREVSKEVVSSLGNGFAEQKVLIDRIVCALKGS